MSFSLPKNTKLVANYFGFERKNKLCCTSKNPSNIVAKHCLKTKLKSLVLGVVFFFNLLKHFGFSEIFEGWISAKNKSAKFVCIKNI